MINVDAKCVTCELLFVHVLCTMCHLKSKVKRTIYPTVFMHYSDTGALTRVSCVTGKYDYHLHCTGWTCNNTLNIIVVNYVASINNVYYLVISEHPMSFFTPRNYWHRIRCNFKVLLQKLRLVCKLMSKHFLSTVHVTRNFRFWTTLFFKYDTSILLYFPLKGRVSGFKESKHDAC